MKRYLPFVIIALVLVGTVVAGITLYRKHAKPAVILTGAPGAEPAHTKGPVSAPAVLEEFGDFQCPPCGTLSPTLDQLEKQYGAKLRLVFRNYPLVMHKNAMAAARAAEAAGLQGHFWDMHHLLYQSQKTWAEAADPQGIFDGYAAKLKLDVARFKADMKSDAVNGRIAADKKRAASVGVESTPTVFVNNQRVQAGPDVAQRLRTAIDGAITKK